MLRQALDGITDDELLSFIKTASQHLNDICIEYQPKQVIDAVIESIEESN